MFHNRSSGSRGALVEHFIREAEQGGQLTMGIIGCLPDNVQQAIKSFSIRNGKQHVTFAFPFMEEVIRNLDESLQSPGVAAPTDRFQYVTPALFFDSCPEVIHGFETLVILVPQANRSTHTVGILTVNQKDSTEGIKQHFRTLMRILFEKKLPQTLWQIPLMVVDASTELIGQLSAACAETVLELHGEALGKGQPSRPPDQLLLLIQEKLIRPCIVTYKELLQLNIQEILPRLNTTDPGYFSSLIELLQSVNCSLVDFRKVDMFFTSPQAEPSLTEFWKVWSHDQVAAKVFPITSATRKLGSLYYSSSHGELCMSHSLTPLLGAITHVPVKEGLQSIIKCLKNQDCAQQVLSKEKCERAKSCNCSVCWGHTCSRPARVGRRLDTTGLVTSCSANDSAFHRPSPCSPYDRCQHLYSAMPRGPSGTFSLKAALPYRLKEALPPLTSGTSTSTSSPGATSALRTICAAGRNAFPFPPSYPFLDSSLFFSVQNYYGVAAAAAVTPSYPLWCRQKLSVALEHRSLSSDS